MSDTIKKYYTIGCCGIDCGLCPRFYTKGDSACPGCGGKNFKDKHPSCGFLTCCASKNGHEVCSECKEYPCKRFDSEKDGYDSFVTHKKVFANLDYINDKGMYCFIAQQKQRIAILQDFIDQYDDGRSKNFFCLSCALLPLETLQDAHEFIKGIPNDKLTIKEQNRLLKDKLQLIANNLTIDLKLIRKK